MVEYIKVKNPRGPGFWRLAKRDFDPAKFELYVESDPVPPPPPPPAPVSPEVQLVKSSDNDISAYDLPQRGRKRG